MFISPETMDKISKANFVDFVQKHTDVCLEKHNGIMYAKNCPFCGSKMPSFQIMNGIYYCHSCGLGGNLLDFIMRTDKCNLVTATNKILSELNESPIALPPSFSTTAQDQTILYDINREAALFYYMQLRLDAGKDGNCYFEKRAVTDSIKQNFALGYAGSFGDNLFRHLSAMFSEPDIMRSGLISKGTKKDPNQYYDKFWDRVIFPILDKDFRVIGFGGRVLGDGKPKYLNSPETPVFSKGENLYCYNLAKSSNREYYICCEGYMDVMSLHQYGFDCAVASLGTALTKNQIKLLSNKKEVLLAYDSDEAGVRATKRAISLCKDFCLKTRVIQIIGAKDPDEYLKKFGAERFEKLIDTAETANHFLLRTSKLEDGRFDYDLAVTML